MTAGRTPLAIVLTEDRVALTGAVGALGVVVGSALTWATVPLGLGVAGVSGFEANGKITFVLGIAALVFVFASFRLAGRDVPVAAGLTGLAAAAVALDYLRDVNAATARVLSRILQTSAQLDPELVSSRFGARAGPGVYVVLAGGALLVVFAVARLARRAGERE